MYYASGPRRTSKNKTSATLVTTDGEIFEGHFFVAGYQRIKDVLNGEDLFIPFENMDGAIYLVNRTSISRVVPREAKEEEVEAASRRLQPEQGGGGGTSVL